MVEETELKPVFTPPLAELLSQAEKNKGSTLTEAEAHQVRDRGICVMMSAEHAQRMDQSRGYSDVDPENCIADWNRMRVQITGDGYLPKLILCLPGGAGYQAQCEDLLKKAGVEYEFRGRDDRMVSAFKASRCMVRPSLTDRDFEALAGHSTVLYALSENFTPQRAATVSRDFLRLGRQLLEAGGLVIKSESSGTAHSAQYWKKLTDPFETADSFDWNSGYEFWEPLYSAYVQLPIQSDADFYSCGMHLLGQPDMIVSRALINEDSADALSPAHQAVDLFCGFGLYVLAECGERGFSDCE